MIMVLIMIMTIITTTTITYHYQYYQTLGDWYSPEPRGHIQPGYTYGTTSCMSCRVVSYNTTAGHPALPCPAPPHPALLLLLLIIIMIIVIIQIMLILQNRHRTTPPALPCPRTAPHRTALRTWRIGHGMHRMIGSYLNTYMYNMY